MSAQSGKPSLAASTGADIAHLQNLYQGPMIGELLERALQKFASRIAFIEDGKTVTYDQLLGLLEKAARRLHALGIGHGEGVVQIASNCVECFAISAACYIYNYKSIVLPPTSSFKDHAYAVKDSGAALLIVDDENLERGRHVAKEVTHPLQVVSHGAGDNEVSPFWQGEVVPGTSLHRSCDPEDIVRQNYTGARQEIPRE